METASIFITEITLPKSEYKFVSRLTSWQILFNILSIIFIGLNTAIEDILGNTVKYFVAQIENVCISAITLLLYPKVRYA